ncbi:MAG: hypothetical protein E7K64_01310 [Clostridia bacterium]|nr:hypothetical protein [Peptococcus niger]MDU7504672.1 hypothetical protein [Clostridia bacterium]
MLARPKTGTPGHDDDLNSVKGDCSTGVKQYEIVATLDSHTSAICQEMDGKRFPISKMEVGVTAPLPPLVPDYHCPLRP